MPSAVKSSELWQSAVRPDVPLADFTTWRIGGPAQYFAEPASIADLVALFKLSREEGIPFTMLGRGSNVLIDDAGIQGLVVCLKRTCMRVHRLDGDVIEAEAGCPMPRLTTFAEGQLLDGFAFIVGVPGTVGAGVAINAGTGGYFGPSLKDSFIGAEVLDMHSGEVRTESADELKLDYRTSSAPARGLVVLNARFQGKPVEDKAPLVAGRMEVLKKRAEKQPLNKNTSGSVFKHVEGGNAAGWYIDRVNMKGTRIGNAQVSEKHANWIENLGDASSSDVWKLIETIRERVRQEFDVDLHPEVRRMS